MTSHHREKRRGNCRNSKPPEKIPAQKHLWILSHDGSLSSDLVARLFRHSHSFFLPNPQIIAATTKTTVPTRRMWPFPTHSLACATASGERENF